MRPRGRASASPVRQRRLDDPYAADLKRLSKPKLHFQSFRQVAAPRYDDVKTAEPFDGIGNQLRAEALVTEVARGRTPARPSA